MDLEKNIIYTIEQVVHGCDHGSQGEPGTVRKAHVPLPPSAPPAAG